MKNYRKTAGITIILAVLAIIFFVIITNAAYNGIADVSRENIILLNHIVKEAEENIDNLDALDDIDADFVIVNLENVSVYSHVSGGTDTNNMSVGRAIEKRYPYSYLSNGKTQYAVILLDDPTSGIKRMVRYVAIAFFVLLLLIVTGIILYGIYVRKNILIPFKNLKDFAAKVAQGKLDEPLEMDRDNMFGAFSESFDIMREELAQAKEREFELQKKERELVASLSHDLKTPVTGIKLTAELMQMRLSVKLDSQRAGNTAGKIEAEDSTEDQDIISFTQKEIANLNADAEGIYKKAEQIDALLADLFTSTLDDIGEFKVNCRDEESNVLADIVKDMDDQKLTVMSEIPAVIINIDRKRMAQVIGNIISNSYKYANTKIDIKFGVSGKYLEMLIKDYGPGVPTTELDLITNKFYRGKDWQDTDKDGHGLGLYIAKSLMNKMSGDLIVESDGKGFAVTLVIPLS